MKTARSIPIRAHRWDVGELDVTTATSKLPAGSELRALFPGAGERRRVGFGDFRSMLETQLAAPTRLRDQHTLECNVQVYEAAAPLRLPALSEIVRTLSASDAPLARVNGAAIQQLELESIMKDYRPPSVQWREADLVFPGERFIQLCVQQDPTAIVEDKPTQAAREATPAPEAAPVAKPVRAPRTKRRPGIPPQFTQPWEFCMTREEALYDMRNMSRSRFARLRARFGRGARMRKWRALLYGRTALEQLWGVRPPTRAYEDGEVIAWAERMLSAAGYDATQCLTEWEIFWRRKGV